MDSDHFCLFHLFIDSQNKINKLTASVFKFFTAIFSQSTSLADFPRDTPFSSSLWLINSYEIIEYRKCIQVWIYLNVLYFYYHFAQCETWSTSVGSFLLDVKHKFFRGAPIKFLICSLFLAHNSKTTPTIWSNCSIYTITIVY